MIISTASQIAHSFARMSHALNEWILDVMHGQLAPGVYPSPEDGIVAKVMHYACTNASIDEMEAHKAFVDVQFLYSGLEGVAVAAKPDNLSPIRLDKDGDNYFYPVPSIFHAIHLTPGVAAVFFPCDLHAGGLVLEKPQEISKVVLKIEVQLAQDIFSAFYHHA